MIKVYANTLIYFRILLLLIVPARRVQFIDLVVRKLCDYSLGGHVPSSDLMQYLLIRNMKWHIPQLSGGVPRDLKLAPIYASGSPDWVTGAARCFFYPSQDSLRPLKLKVKQYNELQPVQIHATLAMVQVMHFDVPPASLIFSGYWNITVITQ